MKKVLLGLFALSAMAMALTNPGDDATSAEANKRAVAGVPMEVRVQILPKEQRLILVDENNKKIDKLEFNHGQLLRSASDSVVSKTVKLMLEDGSSLGDNYAIFVARQNGQRVDSDNDNKFSLDAYGVTTAAQIESELNYRQDVIHVVAAQTEVVTEVISTLRSSAIAAANPGLYIGSGTFEAAITNVANKGDLKTY